MVEVEGSLVARKLSKLCPSGSLKGVERRSTQGAAALVDDGGASQTVDSCSVR